MAATQPGGRPPAPGALALVQAFVNTHYDLEFDHGAELLATPAALAAWLHRSGLIGAGVAADPGDLERALTVREALRALAAGGAETPRALRELDTAGRGAAVEVRFDPTGPRFVAAGSVAAGRLGGHGDPVAGALGVVLALTAKAIADGTWSRLKICPGRHCGWAFYDHSRNRSGRWCAMSVCGGRAKARRHYHRRRAPEA